MACILMLTVLYYMYIYASPPSPPPPTPPSSPVNNLSVEHKILGVLTNHAIMNLFKNNVNEFI